MHIQSLASYVGSGELGSTPAFVAGTLLTVISPAPSIIFSGASLCTLFKAIALNVSLTLFFFILEACHDHTLFVDLVYLLAFVTRMYFPKEKARRVPAT